MKRIAALISWFLCIPAGGVATDFLTLRGGERRACSIAGANENQISGHLYTAAGRTPVPFSIERNLVVSLEFGDDPARDALLSHATNSQAGELRDLWEHYAPLLAVKGAPSARIGIRLGLALLNSGGAATGAEALSVFARIATEAHSPLDRETAEQGKLRALRLLGRTDEALTAAKKFIETKKSGNLWAESSLIVAEFLASELRVLLEDNPRWDLDEAAAKERTRLSNSALDHYLLPALWPGVSQDLAIRGLWGAMQVYQLCNAPKNAADLARDMVSLYPGTAEAERATVILAATPSIAQETNNATEHQGEAEETVSPRFPTPYEEAHPKFTENPILGSPSSTTKRRKRGGDGDKQKPAGPIP